jgi:hypothetical protein
VTSAMTQWHCCDARSMRARCCESERDHPIICEHAVF